MTTLDALGQSQNTSAQHAGILWWCWRMRYLAAKQDAHSAPLLDAIEPDMLALFDRYYTSQLTGARLQAPHNSDVESELVANLIRDADSGLVPFADCKIRRIIPTPSTDPAGTQASTEGRDLLANIQQYRIPVTIAGVVLALIIIAWSFASLGGARAATAPASSVASASASASPSARTSPRPQASPLLGAQRDTTPASLVVGGTVYRVAATHVHDRRWAVDNSMGVASWLAGTVVHPVFCVPTLDGVELATAVEVRDITGAVRPFVITQLHEVKQHQIEVLTPHAVGLTLIDCASGGTVRSLAIAAYQYPQQ